MMVSISCTTYNHAPYIRECLDGFLMQKCNFEFEILIHDDASTDGIQDIIKEYQQKHPNIIKPIFQTENQYSKGQRGMNIKYNFPRAEGKYIALCEGDDYWTDPLKLQRQVDFLEKNTDYSMVAENSKVLDERHNKSYLFSDKKDNYDVSLEEIIVGRKFHTASILFRNENLKLPSNYGEYPFGDTLLFALLAKAGKIKYQPNISLLYRRKDGGASTGKDRYLWAQNEEKFNLLLNEYLDGKFKQIHCRNIYLNYYSAFKWAVKRGRIVLACKSLYKFLWYKNNAEKKILVFINYFGKKSETFISDEIEFLSSQKDVDVTILHYGKDITEKKVTGLYFESNFTKRWLQAVRKFDLFARRVFIQFWNQHSLI